MTSQSIALAVCSGVLVVSNLFGNTLVCLVILLNRHMKTPLNYLLFNLAVADMLIGIFALPGIVFFDFIIQEIDSAAAKVMCSFFAHGTLIFPCAAVSTFSLAAIAYERYQAIVDPLTARVKITKAKTFLFIAVTWVSAICSAVPSLFGIYLYEGASGRECKTKSEYQKIVTINSYTVGALCYGFPIIAMVCLYGRIIWEFIKEQDQVLQQQQLAVSRIKKKITAMLITITIIFAVLWGVSLFFVMKRDKSDSFTIVRFSILINSGINWILYALFSEQFRKCFQRILCCSCKSERGGQDVRGLAANPQGHKASRESDKMDTKL